jgi:hypothetical protein
MTRGFDIGFRAACVALAVAGCGHADQTWTTAPSDDAPASAEPSGPAPDRVVHAESFGSALNGLTLRLAGGATISVPPGAVGSGVTLDMQQVNESALPALLARLSVERSPAGAAYRLTPHGTQFDRPVDVWLPIDPEWEGQPLEALWLADESDTTWESLGVTQAFGPFVRVSMSHFSLLMLVALDDLCMVDNGGCGDPERWRCTPEGKRQVSCEDIDECATDNGGCDPLTVCTNAPGGRTCGSCPANYTGDGEEGCSDVDECATDNGGCDSLTVCTNTSGGRTCSACPTGYVGDGATGCADAIECAVDNGGCGDPQRYACEEVVGGPPTCRCNEWPDETCAGGASRVWRLCSAETSHDFCVGISELGEGECRQQDGAYALEFSVGYADLDPHSEGDNALQARARCEQTCLQYATWCHAVTVITRVEWSTPECHLTTDRATFEAAGLSLQNDYWGGQQLIDGVSYQTYCGGNGDCTHTNWNGGSLYPRAGYACYVLDVAPL